MEIDHPDYGRLLSDLKERIRAAQVRSALAVNRELILLYWEIGRDILARQEAHGWGARIIDRLSNDLRKEFPGIAGFAPRNLRYMRALAEAYPDDGFVQQAVARIPWGHNVRILDRVKEHDERAWYIHQTVANGWSRTVLEHHIGTGLYRRQGKALTNFDRTLPAPQSDLARELIKDPYTFDFLTLAPEASEREVEHALLDRIRDFLLELGRGFALVGSQYHLDVGGQDYYLDLLFYHIRLRCFIVLELKVDDFRPEYAGKMNFYLSAVDDLLRHPSDQPSIGIILCKSRNEVVVEYALRDSTKPMGVARYELVEALPKNLEDALPNAVELRAAAVSGSPIEVLERE